jgi:DNA-binding NarL/FixJ family response regulator
LDQTADNDKNRPRSKSPSRIVLVDPQTLLRAGLSALLQIDREYEVVGEAESVDAAMRVIDSCAPDLVVTDIELRGQSAFPLLAWLERAHPEVPVLVLSDSPAQDKVQGAIAAGAEGYILKDATKSELMRGIRSVLSGKEYVSSEVATRALTGLFGRQKRAPTGRARPLLTARERQILKMIALAETTKSIAAQLNLSVKTVEKHRANLMKKLDLKNSAAVTLYAVRHGLVPIERSRDGSPAT